MKFLKITIFYLLFVLLATNNSFCMDWFKNKNSKRKISVEMLEDIQDYSGKQKVDIVRDHFKSIPENLIYQTKFLKDMALKVFLENYVINGNINDPYVFLDRLKTCLRIGALNKDSRVSALASAKNLINKGIGFDAKNNRLSLDTEDTDDLMRAAFALKFIKIMNKSDNNFCDKQLKLLTKFFNELKVDFIKKFNTKYYEDLIGDINIEVIKSKTNRFEEAFNANKNSLFFDAVVNDSLYGVIITLALGADFNTVATKGSTITTALDKAVMNDETNIVRFLVAWAGGKNLKAHDISLFKAINNKNAEIVKELLNTNINVNRQFTIGELKQHGINLNGNKKVLITAYILASRRFPQVKELFLESKPKPIIQQHKQEDLGPQKGGWL